MGRFDIFPIFIATFASRRVTLIATHSKSQKQTRLPIRYLYFILPFKPLINKEVIKVFQNYRKILENRSIGVSKPSFFLGFLFIISLPLYYVYKLPL